MKNQYFGDVNDYRKYGLLRGLAATGLRVGVCWMLTADDGRSDGRYTNYLDRPERWRAYDPPLFDALAHCMHVERRRDVGAVEQRHLIPGATYWDAPLADDRAAREHYSASALMHLHAADLLFFDPDNGLEVASVPKGRRNSSKYLYWDEVEAAYARGHSVLVYQHFPRAERRGYAARRRDQLRERTGAPHPAAFYAGSVLYLLAGQAGHASRLIEGEWLLGQLWAGEIVRA